MATMTWGEFKDFVDARMQEQGLSEDTYIWYIDISFPDNDVNCRNFTPEVGSDDICGLAID